MGIISAGITTMGLWEYSPKSHSHEHHVPSEKTSNIKKGTLLPSLFETKEDAEKAASEYGCIGAHKMGKKWMPCKMH